MWRAGLVEFPNGSGLGGAHASGDDLSHEVVLAPDRTSGDAAQHRDLTDVSEGVGDRALEQLFRDDMQGIGGRKAVVEGLECGKEPLLLAGPGERLGIAPRLFAVDDGKRPIEQIADVGQDLARSAGAVGGAKIGNVVREVAYGFAAAVGEGRDGVADQLAFGVGCRGGGGRGVHRESV